MKPIFGINNSFVLFLLIHTCWLLATIIVQARSNHHHHHSHPHGDVDHSKSHRTRNIWGSLPASPERWKFMALLKFPRLKNKVGLCSAILINNRSLLTAAHCFENYTFTQPIEVLFKGKSFRKFKRKKDHGLLHKTKSFKVHEKYRNLVDEKKKEPYDIAIVKLENPIVLDPQLGIDRVDLPIDPDGQRYPFDPNNCYLVAYGDERPAYRDERLQQVKVTVLPKELCKTCARDMERQICYGYVRKPSRRTIPKAGAPGDSGGAFLCKTIHFHTGRKHRKLPRYVLIALNSAQVEGDEYQEYFTMGIRITKYMDWIRQNS